MLSFEKHLCTAASGHQKDLLIVWSFQIMSDYIAGDWHCLEVGHVHEFFK